MVFLWDVELFAYLRLCILWHFCKEQEHARTHIKYQYLYLEGKKRWEQRREEGGKETRKHRGREGGLGEWGSLKCHLAYHFPSSFWVPGYSAFYCVGLPHHCSWLFYTPSSWESLFLIAEKTQALRIKISLEPQSWSWGWGPFTSWVTPPATQNSLGLSSVPYVVRLSSYLETHLWTKKPSLAQNDGYPVIVGAN